MLSLVPFYAWFFLLSFRAHKEERFMYVAFPLLSYNAGVSLFSMMSITESFVSSSFKYLVKQSAFKQATKMLKSDFQKSPPINTSKVFSYCLLIIFFILSILRIVAIHTFYNAPLKLYPKLKEIPPPNISQSKWIEIQSLTNITNQAAYAKRELLTCIGKEWYRFPSYYFLPAGFRVGFLKTDFNGLLPKHYQNQAMDSNLLKTLIGVDIKLYQEKLQKNERTYHLIVPKVNDINKEEVDAYVTSIQTCDYFIDLVPDHVFSPQGFEVFDCIPFLDSVNTRSITRAFFIGEKSWLKYCIFRRVLVPSL